MSIRVTCTCDGPTCTTSMPILGGLRDTSRRRVEQAGWIVQVSTEKSTITGASYDAIREFCSEPCQDAYNAKRREIEARELVRR